MIKRTIRFIELHIFDTFVAMYEAITNKKTYHAIIGEAWGKSFGKQRDKRLCSYCFKPVYKDNYCKAHYIFFNKDEKNSGVGKG